MNEFAIILIVLAILGTFIYYISKNYKTNQEIADDPENTITKEELDNGLVYKGNIDE
jgi:cell division protein FtsL